MLRPYRVTLPNGVTTTLLLTRDTAERDYPGAVAVAQETASTPEADEPPAGKKRTK